MPTLVVSDLHLGSATRVDVLRDPEPLDALTAALRERRPERLVLLGDTVELRHGPVREALASARPVLAALGSALDPDAEVVLAAGNHDHQIVAPWLERRALAGDPPLAIEQVVDADATEVAAAIAGALGGPRVRLAYPGLWLRDDVFATHGHYLDRHVTVPTFERLVAGAMVRAVGRMPETGATPEDYEAALAPIYAWLHVVARYSRVGFGAERQGATARAWRMLSGTGGAASLRGRAARAAFPGVVRGLQRAGLGPLRPDVSPVELRRAGLRAMREVVDRLGIDARSVLFGHTHRAGPLAGDDGSEWGPLVNTGCWVREEAFVGRQGADSPYWPGTVVEVPDTGPPVVHNLLGGKRAAALV